MQLWITGPKGDLGGLRPGLEKQWRRAAKDAGPFCDLHFVEPLENEFHGDLLTRLWVTEIRDCPDHEHIISEIDFIPARTRLSDLSGCQHPLVGVQYARRVFRPEDDCNKVPGELKVYEIDGVPLFGAWFLYIRLTPENMKKLPPENWLAAAGEFNDAANFALKHALESGFTDEPCYIQGKDAFPVVHGLRYPHVGTHAFYASSFDAPPDKPINGYESRVPLLAGTHFSNVRSMLR